MTCLFLFASEVYIKLCSWPSLQSPLQPNALKDTNLSEVFCREMGKAMKVLLKKMKEFQNLPRTLKRRYG